MIDSEPIGSKNHRLKRLRRLVRQRKARSEERAFVVEGPVLVREALQSGLDVEEVFFEGDLDGDLGRELQRYATLGSLAVRPVFAGTLSAVLDTVNPQGIAAVVALPDAALSDLDGSQPVLVLVDVQDPGNVGTLIRTAEASGCAGVVLAGESVDATNPKVVRSAAGAFFRLPVITTRDTLGVLSMLRSEGRIVAATVLAEPGADGVVDYDKLDLRSAAIVLGNEAHGLSEEITEASGTLTTIPLAGPTESLNVAAAGAVLCFASWQQRRLDQSS